MILSNTIRTQHLVEEEHNLETGEITEVKRLLKTSISAIAKQLTKSETEAISFAKSLRYRMGNGLSLKEGIEEIVTKEFNNHAIEE